ncbi:MAG TPA: cupredoxin domain-containing protein [Thermoleophilaceae bacterium]
MRAAGAAVVVAAALAAGGCGEDRSESTSTETTPAPPAAPAAPRPPAEPPPTVVRLREAEYSLDPAHIRVDRPATLEIRARNAGARPHALAVAGRAVDRRTRTLAPGESQSLRVKLSKPGRYRWWCPVDGHARRGMSGTITVARPK